ncbi:hypothetical protein SLS62_010142 [Diatrype stigma]|uniref:Pinin/SDK/MemA protein domain-containing protein n=1 Tax=Diatrype stigma TaxID=117547 RepID=A0AAN9UB52_9PEZI
MPDHNERQPIESGQDNNVQKRKASSPPHAEHESSTSPKRNKLDDNVNGKDAPSRPASIPKDRSTDRRPSASQEERNRGRRLYGGLLNTLSGTTTNTQQKRRQEIERRQQAKVSQQRVEDDKHRQEKLAKLNTARKVEQIKFDEQVAFEYASNGTFFAHCKDSQIKKQKETIEEQIQDAEIIVGREVADFKQRKEERLRALGVALEPPTPEPEKTPRKTVDDRPTDIPQPDSTNHAPPQTDKVGHERESDETGDVMVEEAEDTVIY